jgi:steroid 5-alpha reductase family enzyme
LLGLPVALAGLLIRAWAAGHIVKNEQLTTTGPYAHSRNPLYFGSFLIASGFALAAHWSLLLVVIALFVFIYGPTIEQERSAISARFPRIMRYRPTSPLASADAVAWAKREDRLFQPVRQRWQNSHMRCRCAWLIARSTWD